MENSNNFRGRLVLVLCAFILSLTSCSSSRIPDKKIPQYRYTAKSELIGDSIAIYLNNPLHCPIRVWMSSEHKETGPILDSLSPIVLAPLRDSVLLVAKPGNEYPRISFSSSFGDPNQPVYSTDISLPFPEGKSYKVIQGNNSLPTHNTSWSMYAFDFGLAIGDTICAATDGYVVGVVEGYEYGGSGSKWRDYGNFITIYDDSSGLYTQYVHLILEGSLVKLGDKISAGQPIGISGMTGQTNIAHLHFNCLVPVPSRAGLRSTPVDAIGGYPVSSLTRGRVVANRTGS